MYLVQYFLPDGDLSSYLRKHKCLNLDKAKYNLYIYLIAPLMSYLNYCQGQDLEDCLL